MEAVGSRVKSDIELDLLFAEQVSECFRICALCYESTLFEDIVYVCVFAYVIRDKLLH